MNKQTTPIILFLIIWLAVEAGAWGIQLAVVKIAFTCALFWVAWKCWQWGMK